MSSDNWMEVYRITLARYSGALVASGRAARWNSKGSQVIYSAETRSLACLENLVHRSGAGLDDDFRVIVISWPSSLTMETVSAEVLPENWRSLEDLRACQRIGDEWLTSMRTAVLRVPSVIIPEEWNVLINPLHPDFKKIRIKEVQPFMFDPRMKA
jgi:RES domain-containing protein